MTVKEYKLVTAPADEIEDTVNRWIAQGWQPFGTPFIMPAKPEDLTLQHNMVYQAMVLPVS